MKNGVNILILAAAFLVAACAPESVTIGSLLDEMTDRGAIAEYPSPDYTAKQYSSYERKSVVKDGEGWYANSDKSYFIRYEEKEGRTEYVMFDAEGPGAITRWWMTFAGENCGTGTLRIYIDNAVEPTVEASAFDILSGGLIVEGVLGTSVSELSPYENRGHNLYYPIPYAERCVITYDSANLSHDDKGNVISKEDVYYNILYRTYEAGTKVVSYSPEEVKRYEAKAAQVSGALVNVAEPETDRTVSLDGVLRAGESKSVTIEGEKAIELLAMRLEAEKQEQALRSTVLSIEFDGQPKVWVPVGEFYRVGYKQLDMRSWYVQASEDGDMAAYWVMPFRNKAVVTLTNAGDQDVTVADSRVGYSKYNFGSRTMYFGADWHMYPAVDTRVSPVTGIKGDKFDINFTTLKGKGVYAGDGITLYNTTYAWWGEGDEKIYVDGEEFPSHFGTGTEDYYGYAWCRSEVFTGHPYIAQPDGSGDFAPGYVVNTRFRGLDGVPFKEDLVVDMEIWHWAHCIMDYAVTTFHYMLPGGTDVFGENFEQAVAPVTLSHEDILPLDEDGFKYEAEHMELENAPAGNFERWAMFDGFLSSGCQIFWRNIPVGSELVLSFDSPYEGRYKTSIQYTTSWDFGKFDVWFNGKKIDSSRDLYSKEFALAAVDYGTLDLRKENNILKIVAKSPVKGFNETFFGIDKMTFTR